MPRVQPGPRGGHPDDEERTSPGTWEGRLRLWIAINGRIALGPGKIRLLEAIAATKSLSAAAKQLRMSYRHAWKHVHLIEERSGITVVEPQRGGSGGGGTDLTPQGRALLKAYRGFHNEVDEQMRLACNKYFGDWSTPQVDDGGASNSESSEASPPDSQDTGALPDEPPALDLPGD